MGRARGVARAETPACGADGGHRDVRDVRAQALCSAQARAQVQAVLGQGARGHGGGAGGGRVRDPRAVAHAVA